MTGRAAIPVFVLMAALALSAGCTHAGTAAPPLPAAVPAAVATAAPAPSADTTPGTPSAPPLPAPVTTGTAAPAPPATLPVATAPAAGYRFFSDADYSLEYPASWQANETVLPVPEFVHTKQSCMVTTYYQTTQDVRFFTSPDGNALIYTSIVDTETDVWPRDINGQIVYADIANAFLGDPTHCANTPAGAFTISSVTQAQVPNVSYPVTRVDFGKINSSGFADGAGTMFVVTGNHKHGVFAFYAADSTGGAWNEAGAHMFNTLSLNTYF